MAKDWVRKGRKKGQTATWAQLALVCPNVLGLGLPATGFLLVWKSHRAYSQVRGQLPSYPQLGTCVLQGP